MKGCLFGLNRTGLSLKPKCELYVRSASIGLTLELQMNIQRKWGAQILLFNYKPSNFSYSWIKYKCSTGCLYDFSLGEIPLIPFNTSAVRKERDEEKTGGGLISHTCKGFWLVNFFHTEYQTIQAWGNPHPLSVFCGTSIFTVMDFCSTSQHYMQGCSLLSCIARVRVPGILVLFLPASCLLDYHG